MINRRSLLTSIVACGSTALLARATPTAQPKETQGVDDNQARYQDLLRRILAAFPYSRVETAGPEALATWQRHKAPRQWPVVVGDDEQLSALADQYSADDPAIYPPPPPPFRLPPARSPDEILRQAATLEWTDIRAGLHDIQGEVREAPLGEWPSAPDDEGAGLTVNADVVSGRAFDRVHLLLIPTEQSWQVPAYLRWGNWNACPPPELHVAMLRRWHERYGAELVGINRDTMNIRVARRPADREEALALAREQFAYCPDIVDQGLGSLAPLAALLMASDWWYFWWD